MKIHWLAILLIFSTVLIVPSASAKIIEEKDGYIVTAGDSSYNMPYFSKSGFGSISQGETILYSTDIPPGKIYFNADLNWGDSSNSLSLTLLPPDSTLGPYYDYTDGQIDGRINLRISKSGDLTSGSWGSRVYGYSVSGVQSFSYSAYAS